MLAQLDNSKWVDLVKDVVRHWYESDRLNQHPLTKLRIVERQAQSNPSYASDPYRRARALRQVIKSAIAAMGVDGEDPPKESAPKDPLWTDRRWRHYNILTLSLQYAPLEVAERISISLGGQFYRDQVRAFEALAEILRLQEGNPITDSSTAMLSYPSGAVKLDDPLYIERDVDKKLTHALMQPGGTITIRGPRQIGKTSLLARGIYHGRRQFDPRLVYFDLQSVEEPDKESLDIFLRAMAAVIFDELDLDPDVLGRAWSSQLPPTRKLTKLMQRHVLVNGVRPVLLAMDEIDQLQQKGFGTEFFGLIRFWHNQRATSPHWNKLSILMAISTEPYLLIDDLHQSPFNVGEVLLLNDFNPEQVADLNHRYGAPVASDDLPRLITLLGGRPYLTQVALYTMVTDRQAWADLEVVAASDEGPFHQHLQSQYRLIIGDERLRNAFREIIRTNRCTDAAAGFRLMKGGLVTRTDDDCYDCRCDLYRRYFAKKL